jgi:RNA polymerase sigma factor (TIGR02999 family)
MLGDMADVTQILTAIEAGDPHGAAELLPLVYDELRQLAAARMAAEPAGHTLQPTALVHEAYLRLVGSGQPNGWGGRGHFFAAAAEAMRRILVDAARRKRRVRRGGELRRHSLDGNGPAASPDGDVVDHLALSEALDRLAAASRRRAELVKLRYFAGLTLPEVAAVLRVSQSTAEADWTYAKAWLKREMGESG